MSNWDINAISNAVRHRFLCEDGPIKSILYEGEPYLGNPTEVFAYLGVPANCDQPVPGMVCVHGGGGKAFKEWVEMWVERGYAAIAMDLDLGGRDGDSKRLKNGGPRHDHEAIFSTTAKWQDMWTYHAVSAAMRACSILGSQPEVARERIGITGVSWGGYVTCIAAAVDARFACGSSVYGCGFLQHNSCDDWMKIFACMTAEQKQAWHDKCDPSVFLDQVKIPMLFVSGTNDFAFPLDIYEMSCALPAGDVTRCVRIDMAHGHKAGWAAKEVGAFADYHLLNGPSFPKISACTIAAGNVQSGYVSKSAITRGYLVYTRCGSRWQDRKWQADAATVTDTTVFAALPEDVTSCFLAIEDDRGIYVSSPCRDIAAKPL